MTDPHAERSMHEQLARRLRHEVGDFLQKVYATVAILQQRLPPELAQERDLLTRLRARAETCKHLINDVQDFLCPFTLACEPIDLAEVAARLVATAGPRHPQLDIRADGEQSGCVVADPSRIAQAGQILLANACEAAEREVRFTTRHAAETGEIEWTIMDDGPGVATEVAAQMFTPFFTTRTGHAGLGLTLAHQIVQLHNGRIHTETLAPGGFRVKVWLPAQAVRQPE
jgi:signal transduction histidine kinase